MEIIREVGEKGQVVIPKDIRKMLGIRSRSKVVFEISGEEVKVKLAKKAEDFLKEFLKHRKKGKGLTLEKLKKIEDESYDLP